LPLDSLEIRSVLRLMCLAIYSLGRNYQQFLRSAGPLPHVDSGSLRGWRLVMDEILAEGLRQHAVALTIS
jgi:hypothetical protein